MTTATATVAETEPLFDSSHAALTFAFQFSADQYDRPMMNRMADGPRRPGKGLAGLDGAAQAGMIRAEVATFGRLREAIVTAWFAPRTLPCSCRRSCCTGHKDNLEWTEAIAFITQAALEKLSGKVSNYRLRRSIVMRNFRVGAKLMDLADQCGVHRDTAAEHNAILTAWLSGDRKRHGAIGEIGKTLTAVGERLADAGLTYRT